MIYLVNPGKGRKARKRRKGSRVATRKKRRTAAQKRATARLVALNKRKRRKPTAAKKRRRAVKKSVRRKRATAIKSRKRRSTRKGGSVKMARRKSSRRGRKRRRSSSGTLRFRRIRGQVYAKNAPILKVAKQGAMDAVAVLGGGAAARVASNVLPLPKDGLTGAAASLAVAAGIGVAARKFLGADTARMVTAGAMQVPIKNLITSFVPQAAGLLGDYDGIGAYVEAGVGSYPALSGAPLDSVGGGEGMGSYAEVVY